MVKPKDKLKLGLFRHVPTPWELEENFDVFLRALDTASAEGIELLVTPECFLDGYASPDAQSTRERLFGIAQEVGKSSCLEKVAQEAKNRRMGTFWRLRLICLWQTGRDIFSTAVRSFTESSAWAGKPRPCKLRAQCHYPNF